MAAASFQLKIRACQIIIFLNNKGLGGSFQNGLRKFDAQINIKKILVFLVVSLISASQLNLLI